LGEKVGIEMGKKIGKQISVEILFLIIFITSWAVKAEALEPRLLWEKTMPFEIGSIIMAKQSGDVIISSRDAGQIILYDKQGNKRFHWGPRIYRQTMGIDISDNGNILIYQTSWTEHHRLSKKLDWDSRVHYCTRTGKELWNKQIAGSAFLSPNGSLVAVVREHGMGGVPLTVLDSRGNLLWRYNTREVVELLFPPMGIILSFTNTISCTYLIDRATCCGKKMIHWSPTQSLRARNILLHGIKRSMTSKEIFLWKAKLLYP
jgi:hypothetical protein